MLRLQTVVCIMFVFALALSTTVTLSTTVNININATRIPTKCSEYIKMPKDGFIRGPLFPILSPEELQLDCWNLEAFRNCLIAIGSETEQEKMIDSFILLNFLTRICYKNKEIYLNNTQCINSYKETTEIKSCIKDILPDQMCSIVNERIDCIGREVAKCGPDAVRLTKLLIRTIFQSVWRYYYISCPTLTPETVSPSNGSPALNDSSKISSSMLKLLALSLLYRSGFY